MKHLNAHAKGALSALGLVVLACLILAANSSALVVVLSAAALALCLVYAHSMAASFRTPQNGNVLYIDFAERDVPDLRHPHAA